MKKNLLMGGLFISILAASQVRILSTPNPDNTKTPIPEGIVDVSNTHYAMVVPQISGEELIKNPIATNPNPKIGSLFFDKKEGYLKVYTSTKKWAIISKD